jgi:hypothetical protein
MTGEFPQTYERWRKFEAESEREATFRRREPFILVPVTFDEFKRYCEEGKRPYHLGSLLGCLISLRQQQQPRRTIAENDDELEQWGREITEDDQL